MIDRLIRNCDALVYKGDEPDIVFNQDIAIEKNLIKEIADSGSIKTGEKTEVIEADGLLAVPGFINTHAHIPMVLFRCMAEDITKQQWFNDYIWPMESNLTEEDVYWGAMLSLAEMIESGVTTVADHYFYMDAVAKAVSEAGTRANLVWAVFGHEGEEKVDQTVEFINRWQGKADGRITTWLGPHAPYTTSPEFLAMCAKKAEAVDVGIHIHVSESQRQVDLSMEEFGITPVQLLQEAGVMDRPTILGHCKYPQEIDYPILVSSPTGIAQAPKTYMRGGMGMAPIKRYLEEGIPFGLATDGAASNITMDIMEQMRLMALLSKYKAGNELEMPLGQTVDIAFRGSAKVMKMEGQIGELKSGMLADIALIRQDGLHQIPKVNPIATLIFSSRATDVDTVLCNGEVLMKNRKLLTIDKEQVKKEVQSRVSRLSKRVPDNRIAVYPT